FAGPRIVFGPSGTTNDPALATPLDTSTGDTALALYVQAEQNSADADHRNRTIHWNSDVVISSGPSPLLIIGPDGQVVTSVNITANGVANPAPFDSLSAHPYVEVNDLINHNTGDVWMQTAGGNIDGGSMVGSHYWGTFTFRDNWRSVTILNQSKRELRIDNIKVINTTAVPKVQLNTPSGGSANPTFAIVRQVDATLVDIEGLNSDPPDVLLNGKIENPIGTTRIAVAHGSI